MSGIFSDMHNLFQVSKTLRFELKPIGKTEENLAQIIVQDEDRAKRFKKVKKYADDVHRQFIDDSLKKVDKDALRRAITEYCESKKNSDDKKIDDAMKKARTVISDSYKDARSTKHKTNPLSPKNIIGKLKVCFKDNADAMDNINKQPPKTTTIHRGPLPILRYISPFDTESSFQNHRL